MAGFDGTDIDDLAYDFTKWLPEPMESIGYTPGKHEIPEPTSTQILTYFATFVSLMRDNRNVVNEFSQRQEALDEKDVDGRRAIEAEYETWSEQNAQRTIEKRREFLAKLCSENPNAEILAQLPGRIFDSFETYIQNQFQGKG